MPKPPATPLSPKQVRQLRALAHDLKPVVRVGKNGYGPGLRLELDQALTAHELIKVKLEREAAVELAELREHATRDLGSVQIGTLGRVLIPYRAHPKQPKIRLVRDGDESRS